VSWASEQVERYRALEPLYSAFSDRLYELLEKLLDDEEIPFGRSYSWTRGVSSFESALLRTLREGRDVGDRLDLVGDMAGVVFTGNTLDEAEAIAAVVERELDIDYAHSLPPAAARAANERDLHADPPALRYAHTTYFATPGESRLQLSEWRPYAGLYVEVHVPTVSQYAAWTIEMTHQPYYWPDSHPPPSREAFARVAALFASADEALASEEAARESVDARFSERVAAGDLDVPLDARALAVYLRESPVVAELVAIEKDVGMSPDEDAFEPTNTVLEQELLWLLRRNGISTLAELDAFLRDSAPRAPAIFGEIARLSSQRGFEQLAAYASAITYLLLVLNRADAETVELVEYAPEIEAALNTLIGNPVAPEQQ
jgi:uncharacterized tellurite resistance protein B-like protein